MSAAPIRVHVLIDSLTWGGAELLLADLAEGGREHGLELSVGYLHEADLSPAAPPLRAAGVEPVFVGAGRLADPRSLVRVRDHLATARPDVVHTQLDYADVLGGIAARTLGLAAVSTIHVTPADASGRARARGRLAALARDRCAARVIAVSEHVRAMHIAAGWGRAEHFITIHNGIAVRPVPGAGRAVRSELGLSADDVVAAIVGVLRPGKGHRLAVEAVRALQGSVRGLRLLIVGDGPARREVTALAGRLDPPAVMAGHRDDVMAVLDAADVLLHPSRVDAFPTVLLQALAAGVPVVAAHVGGIPEIVGDERAGLLVRPPLVADRFAELLARLLADEALRRRMAEEGRKRFLAEFTAERWAERLRAVYEEARAT